jgi:tetratricopeptide (TPR) repeat protein
MAAKNRNPILVRLFNRYLNDLNPARFTMDVANRYGVATIARIADSGQFNERRAAILALTFLGDYRNNALFGRALLDDDRGVRMLADDGVREIWSRAGNIEQQRSLAKVKRLNDGGMFADARVIAEAMCDAAPKYGEAWNQLGIAQFFSGDVESAVYSCWQVLAINPYQFEAAVGLGHAYLELGEPLMALDNFRQALKLNPSLESIRIQVKRMQRTYEQS